jgi:hypothetical protein
MALDSFRVGEKYQSEMGLPSVSAQLLNVTNMQRSWKQKVAPPHPQLKFTIEKKHSDCPCHSARGSMFIDNGVSLSLLE